MKISAQDVKKLRDRTQSGYMDCKKALIESNGDMGKAQEILRKKGFKIIDGPSGQTEQGVICSYIHPGDRIGVILEMKCKTDFVAKTEEFKHLAKEMAMQVASMKPEFISRAEVPLDVVSKEAGYRIERLIGEGIGYENESFQIKLDGEMAQWYSEVCLLEQPYIRDNKVAIKTLLADLISKTGEPCKIARFERWEIGPETEQVGEDCLLVDTKSSKFQIPSILLLIFIFGIILSGIVIGVC